MAINSISFNPSPLSERVVESRTPAPTLLSKQVVEPGATVAAPLMNFPHAYDDISVKALIAALNRIIAKMQKEKTAFKHLTDAKNKLIKLKNEVEKNGLPEDIEKISWLVDRLKNETIKTINNLKKSNEIWDFFSKEKNINMLTEAASDFHSINYYLRPNALMIMRRSDKQDAFIKQEFYDHTKISSSTKNQKKAKGSDNPSARTGNPSVRIKGLGLRETVVSASSIRSNIKHYPESKLKKIGEGIAIKDPIQPPPRGKLASVEQMRIHERALGSIKWEGQQQELFRKHKDELPPAFVERMQKKFSEQPSSRTTS